MRNSSPEFVDEPEPIDVDSADEDSPTVSSEPTDKLEDHPCPVELVNKLLDPNADATPWPALLSSYLPGRSHLLQNFYLLVAGSCITKLVKENRRLTTEAYRANKRKLDKKSDLRWSTAHTLCVKSLWKKEIMTKMDDIRQAPEKTVRCWQGTFLLMRILVALEACDTIRGRNERLEQYKREGWKDVLMRS